MDDRELKTFFISGHRDITEEEFIKYKHIIRKIDCQYDARYIIGDYHGVDIMAQNYLLDTLKINPLFVTVCHMHDKPRNVNDKVINLIGGFKTDEERDSFMTNHSDCDIAFIRPDKTNSGTAQNIIRRHLL